MLAFLRSTKCCLCGGRDCRGDAGVVEEGLHGDAEALVVAVDAGPVRGLASPAGAADPGQDGGDDLVAEGEQGGDGAGRLGRDVVAAGPAGLGGEVLAAELAQVVGGLPGGVAAVVGQGADLGGMLGDGESVWRGGQGQRGRQGGADPGPVEVDAGGAGGAEPGGQWQVVEGGAGDEGDVGAVECGGEPAGDAGEAGDDLGEVADAAAAAQFPGVADGGFEAQDVFALGAGLALEQPEADPEPGQAVLGVLDHDLLRGRAGRPVAVRPVLQAEQGPQGGDVQPGPGPVEDPVKQVFHLSAGPDSRLRLYSAW